VEYAQEIGLSLVARDRERMIHRIADPGIMLEHEILQMFPFTSDAKRMGIVVQEKNSNEIIFYLKGADTVMKNIVKDNDWLDEACEGMARQGLRTLVVARKLLTKEEWVSFQAAYTSARCAKSANTSGSR